MELLNKVCPYCGKPFVIFYNAGMPVIGCKSCHDRQQLSWASNTNMNSANTQINTGGKDYERKKNMPHKI